MIGCGFEVEDCCGLDSIQKITWQGVARCGAVVVVLDMETRYLQGESANVRREKGLVCLADEDGVYGLECSSRIRLIGDRNDQAESAVACGFLDDPTSTVRVLC